MVQLVNLKRMNRRVCMLLWKEEISSVLFKILPVPSSSPILQYLCLAQLRTGTPGICLEMSLQQGPDFLFFFL